MAFKTVIQVPLPESVTAKIGATIVDESAVVIPLADLTTLTLTLYDLLSGSILNGRNDTDIKNANGGVVNATTGAMTYTMTPADNVISNNNLSVETHIALLEWTYSTGTKAGKHEVHFQVKNLTKVP